MDFYNAEKQFNENFCFVSPKIEPEKYNLYAGLANLAKGLQNLQNEFENLRIQLQKIGR